MLPVKDHTINFIPLQHNKAAQWFRRHKYLYVCTTVTTATNLIYGELTIKH